MRTQFVVILRYDKSVTNTTATYTSKIFPKVDISITVYKTQISK